MGRRAASLDQAGLRLGCHRHRAGIDVYKRQAGARPDQRGDENKTPLEFLLNRDFEFAVRMTYLPRLVDRAQTTRMVLAPVSYTHLRASCSGGRRDS